MAPGGRQPVCMENIKMQRLPAPKKAIKPQPQCVSYSEAASGLLTSYQGTDALTSLPGSPYQATHATDTHPRGWVRRAGNTPPCAASFFPYSFFAGEERIWPPEGASPLAWKKLRRSGYHPSKKATSPAPPKRRTSPRLPCKGSWQRSCLRGFAPWLAPPPKRPPTADSPSPPAKARHRIPCTAIVFGSLANGPP